MPISSSYTHATLPAWYAGQQQRLGEAAEGARQAPYQRYQGNRFANFYNDDVTKAYELARQQGIDKPYLNEANTMSREGANAKFDPSMIEQYLNPYNKHVVQQMEELANKQFYDKTLPNLKRQFVNTGTYKSGARTKAVDDLIKEHERELNNARYRALNEGYRPAAEQAGKMHESRAARQLEGANVQSGLAPLAQAGKLSDVEALRQVGAEQRDREQAERDFEYQNFQQQENYPYRMQQHQAGILTGMPQRYQDVYSGEQTPGTPQLNTAGNLSGIAASAYGARMAGGYGRKAGGAIKKPKAGLSAMPLMQSSMSKKPKLGGSLGIKHLKNKDKNLYGKSSKGRSVS